ncbi:MAG: thioredoxin family protein [Chitinophagaceae bacterium]|nr:thioredoxin family protein [Chitinophagaceae bacterium]
MKYLLLLILILVINLSAISIKHKEPDSSVKEPLKIGGIIPKANVKMENYAGAMVSLREAGMENGLLVVFSSNTCLTVVENNLRMIGLVNYAFRNHIGVIVLNSNEKNRDGSDSKETMKVYAEELGYRCLYVVDKNSEMANAFGAQHTPECYLFNKLGRLVYKGAIDNSPHNEMDADQQYLKQAITEISQGQPVSIKETEAVGCPIKRK